MIVNDIIKLKVGDILKLKIYDNNFHNKTNIEFVHIFDRNNNIIRI